MSDFDKEAEREKLREKYEQDEADREATERMSDLLLKGATMTNAHCGTCGDPIFRYDGQEFCSTCEEVVLEGEAEDGSTQTAADGQAGQSANGRTDTATGDGDGATAANGASPPESPPSPGETGGSGESEAGAEPSHETPPGRRAGRDPDTVASGGTGASTHEGTASPPETGGSEPRRSDPSADVVRNERPQAPARDTPSETVGSGDRPSLADARASLTELITALSNHAASADDVERTRAYLAAVEDAADALDAVNDADR